MRLVKKGIMGLLLVAVVISVGCVIKVPTTATPPLYEELLKVGEMRLSWYKEVVHNPDFEAATWTEDGNVPANAKMLAVWFDEGSYPRGLPLRSYWVFNGEVIGSRESTVQEQSGRIFFNIFANGNPMPTGTYEVTIVVGKHRYEATFVVVFPIV